MADLSEVSDVTDLVFSPGWSLAGNACQPDSTIRLWNARSAALAAEFPHGAPIDDLVFNADDSRLVSCAERPPASDLIEHKGKYIVRLWQLNAATNGVELQETIGTKEALFDPHGAWFVVSDGNLLRLWSTGDLKSISSLYLDFSDGRLQKLNADMHGHFLYMLHRREVIQLTTEEASEKSVRHTVQVWNAEHIFDVRRLVDERRLITCEHHVAGPNYTRVVVKAEIVRGHPIKPSLELQRTISEVALHDFFHPQRGGPDGKGWPWGRDVYRSEVYQLLESVEGVDHVESLTILPEQNGQMSAGSDNNDHVSIPEFHLIDYVADIDDITIVDAGMIRPQQITYRVH